MDIIIGKNSPIQNKSTNKTVPIKAVRRMANRDQRKNRQDRRQSVRDGVIVSLSFKKDRRKSGGRRDTDNHRWA